MLQQRPLPLTPDTDWTATAPPCLDGIDTVDLDCETTGLHRFRGQPVGLAVGYAGRTQYLPFAHRGGGNLDEAVVKRWAQTELRGKRIRNLKTKVDIHWMQNWGVDLRAQGNTFHDVSHSEALLDDHETAFNLNHLAGKRLGQTKLDAGPAIGLQDLPASAVAAYAERDVALVAALAEYYAPRLAEEDLGRVADLEDAIIPVVVEMERNGMPLDLEALESMVESSRVLWEQLSWELYRMVGYVVNPNSTAHLVRLWQACGEPVTHLTETGAPSFTADVVRDAATRHPAIALLWRIGKLDDLRTKYLLKYQRDHEDGVLYPSLNQLMTDEGGTISGRFSCVKPNLQQVMAANKHTKFYGWLQEYGPETYLIKRLFRPAAGVWLSADMKQCEYRIFTHYSQSPRLLDQYARDPLTNFHALVKALVLPVRPDINDTEVKVFNFLSVFGGGVGAASRTLGIGQDAARLLSEAYHQQFPEARELLNKVMRVADERGYVKTFLGRRCRFPGRPGHRDRLHKALNAVVQGTGADANKLALIDLYRRRVELGLTMRMTTHDSFDGDCVGNPAETRAVLDTQRLALRVPLLWGVKTGATWASAA